MQRGGISEKIGVAIMIAMTLLAAIAIGWWVFSAPAPSNVQQTATVAQVVQGVFHGQVLDQITKAPIANAVVLLGYTCDPANATPLGEAPDCVRVTTNASGWYQSPPIQETNPIGVIASATGYYRYVGNVQAPKIVGDGVWVNTVTLLREGKLSVSIFTQTIPDSLQVQMSVQVQNPVHNSVVGMPNGMVIEIDTSGGARTVFNQPMLPPLVNSQTAYGVDGRFAMVVVPKSGTYTIIVTVFDPQTQRFFGYAETTVTVT